MWLRRIRGAIGMGVTWAVAWAGFGILIGVSSKLLPFLPWDAFFAFYDAPLPTLAMPGFLGGALFSVVLGIAARRRRFSDLSLPKFALWGGLGGLLVSLIPATMVALDLAHLRSDLTSAKITAIIGVPLVLMSAVSAAGTLLLARRAERAADRQHEGAGAVTAETESAGELGDGSTAVGGIRHRPPESIAAPPSPPPPSRGGRA